MTTKMGVNQVIAVVGSGWSAVSAASFLVASGKSVIWLEGSGSRIAPLLPTAEAGHGAEAWEALARLAGFEPPSGLQSPNGIFLREFHPGSKAFVAISPEEPDDGLLAPEKFFWSLREHQLSQSLNRIETRLRENLTTGVASSSVTRIAPAVPINSIDVGTNPGSLVVKLPDGQELSHVSKVVFCDHWSEARRLGLLDPRNRVHPFSVIQASFHFKTPLPNALEQGLVIRLPRDSAEDSHRLAFGQVSADGLQTTWTIFASGEEGEDNAFISGKIRKLKRTLEKVFAALAHPFSTNLLREQVRLEENFFRSDWLNLDSGKKLPESTKNGVVLALDAWGPSRSIAALIAGLQSELREDIFKTSSDKELVFTPSGPTPVSLTTTV